MKGSCLIEKDGRGYGREDAGLESCCANLWIRKERNEAWMLIMMD
jgi:hypothetical protein